VASTKSKHTPASAVANGLGLTRAVQEESRARMLAEEERRLGRRLRRRETFALGHEPVWLGRAKVLYARLGLMIDVLSHDPAVPAGAVVVPPDLTTHATRVVKAFLDGGDEKVETLERRWFLERLDDVVYRRGAAKNVKDPNVGFLAILGVSFGVDRLAQLTSDEGSMRALRELIDAWASTVPRPGKPSKWRLAARVWSKLTNKSPLPDKTMRLFWMKVARERRKAQRA